MLQIHPTPQLTSSLISLFPKTLSSFYLRYPLLQPHHRTYHFLLLSHLEPVFQASYTLTTNSFPSRLFVLLSTMTIHHLGAQKLLTLVSPKLLALSFLCQFPYHIRIEWAIYLVGGIGHPCQCLV